MDALYQKVWSPEGVPFEVAPERAADLVLNKGWSNTPPKSVSKKTRKKQDTVAHAEADKGETLDEDKLFPSATSGE